MRTKVGVLPRIPSRLLALLALIVVAVPILLANFTPSDYELTGYPLARPEWRFEYGWPLIWYWRQMSPKPGRLYDLGYGGANLLGNLAIWSVILAATWTTADRLTPLYRMPLRWSLRKLLAVVAVISVLCGWCASLRDRANIQDPLITEIEGQTGDRDGLVNLERWGPKWLDLVGADRFRRRVVGVQLYNYDNSTCAGLLNRLARLPGLRFLYIEAEVWTPEMVAALGELRQLRALHVGEIGEIYDDYDDRFPDEVFAVVGKLTRLQVLSVTCNIIRPDGIRRLANLTDLSSLRLNIHYTGESEQELQDAAETGERAALADLPVLPRLEFIGFDGDLVGAEDLSHLASFRLLKAVDLQGQFVT